MEGQVRPLDDVIQKPAASLNIWAIGQGFEGTASDWTEYVVWLVGFFALIWFIWQRNVMALPDIPASELGGKATFLPCVQPGGMPWAGQGNFNAFPQAMMGIQQPKMSGNGRGVPDGGCGMSFQAAMPGVQGMPGLATGMPSELQQQMVMMQQLQHQQQLLQQQLQQQQQQQQQQQAPAPMPGADKDQQAFTLVVDSLSSAEKGYYTTLWGIACPNGETLAGKAAFDFLSKSQLPREILKRIWDISDRQKRGLGWEEFVVTMKLIS
ncbi:unnamed protein product, partial [Symbiodinium necroappetens]